MIFTTLLALSLSTVVNASDSSGNSTVSSESRIKREQVDESSSNKKFEDARVLIDPKLRADDGSLSRYSLKFNLSYYGPTLDDLSAKDQPNPDNVVGSRETALGGSMAARYRLSPTQTLSLGTGLRAVYPLHGIERFDLNNPYLYYDITTRVGRLQMRNSPGISVVTLPAFREAGQYAGLSFFNSFMYDFPNTSLAVGLETNFSYYLFSRDYERGDGRLSSYNISFSPTLRYRFSERLNISTSYGLNLWNPRGHEDRFALHNRTPTQNLGIGYALTKEIFLNPYIYFYPNRISADGTTLNFAAIFSVL